MGICRGCKSKWVNRYRRHGEIGLLDRSSTPHSRPTATDATVVARIADLRRSQKWSASRIAFELQAQGITVSRRTVTRQLARLGLNHRKFIDPNGEPNRESRRISARWPGHMVHVDVKKVGRIPDGGGWRVHGRGSERAKNADRLKKKSKRGGYVYLHSAADGFSRLAYSEARITHIERIVTDDGACYRADAFTRALLGHATSASRPTRRGTTARRSTTTGSWETSSPQSTAGRQPPAVRLQSGVTNVLASYT
jgi:transposase